MNRPPLPSVTRARSWTQGGRSWEQGQPDEGSGRERIERCKLCHNAFAKPKGTNPEEHRRCYERRAYPSQDLTGTFFERLVNARAKGPLTRVFARFVARRRLWQVPEVHHQLSSPANRHLWDPIRSRTKGTTLGVTSYREP